MVNTNDKGINQSPIVNSNQLKNSKDNKNNSDTAINSTLTSSSSSSSLISSKPTTTNFSQNAAAQPKLIPIQSVLKTETQHSNQRQHQNSKDQPTILQPTQLSTSSLLHSTAVPPIQQFISNSSSLPTELPQEDEERLGKLFKQLDRDGNGRIDVHDLSEALREFGLSSVYAEKFMEHSDKNQSGDVGLAEFVHYVREHEKNLRLQFSHLDKNKDGKVDLDELISAFKDLGIEVDLDEAKNLLTRMDQDGSLNISFNEWRDFLLLAPSTDIHDLIKFWRHSTYLDIGEDMNVPDDFTQSEMQSGMWWRHLAAGGVAGAVSRTCTAPLDRIKVFLQVQTHKTGISDSLRYMLKEGGMSSLWRGNFINVLKIAPESALKFAAYEKIKRMIRGDEKRQMSIAERFMAGAAAGGISQTVIYPMEVLKTRLALRKTGQYSSIADAARKIYLAEGLRSFYRGYIPNMLGIIPYAGIDLAVYETLKKKYLSSHNTEQPSFLVLLACGSASSTLGQVCSYPLALVRTRLQAQVINVNKSATSTKVGIPMKATGAGSDDNMLGVFRKILRTEGVCGLYRGITPNFIKVETINQQQQHQMRGFAYAMQPQQQQQLHQQKKGPQQQQEQQHRHIQLRASSLHDTTHLVPGLVTPQLFQQQYSQQQPLHQIYNSYGQILQPQQQQMYNPNQGVAFHQVETSNQQQFQQQILQSNSIVQHTPHSQQQPREFAQRFNLILIRFL